MLFVSHEVSSLMFWGSCSSCFTLSQPIVVAVGVSVLSLVPPQPLTAPVPRSAWWSLAGPVLFCLAGARAEMYQLCLCRASVTTKGFIALGFSDIGLTPYLQSPCYRLVQDAVERHVLDPMLCLVLCGRKRRWVEISFFPLSTNFLNR